MIKLHQFLKRGAMVAATREYLEEESTAELIRECVAQLQSCVDWDRQDERRTYSCPDDIRSLIESTIDPMILESVRQQPVDEENTWDLKIEISPETLESRCTDYEFFPTTRLREYAAKGLSTLWTSSLSV
jgi:hypothetical protein